MAARTTPKAAAPTRSGRSAIEALLARAVAPDVPDVDGLIHLPSLDIRVSLCKPGQADQFRMGAWVKSGGPAEELEFRGLLAGIRFCLVDEDGARLLRSYDEAMTFVDVVDPEDLVKIGEALSKINAGDVAEDVEAGKAS